MSVQNKLHLKHVRGYFALKVFVTSALSMLQWLVSPCCSILPMSRTIIVKTEDVPCRWALGFIDDGIWKIHDIF